MARLYIYIYIFFLQYHHMSSQTSWSPPTGLWLKCNRLLRLGRPVGAVTLSRWEWWWNERWIWGARGGGPKARCINRCLCEFSTDRKFDLVSRIFFAQRVSYTLVYQRAYLFTRSLVTSSGLSWNLVSPLRNVTTFNPYWFLLKRYLFISVITGR